MALSTIPFAEMGAKITFSDIVEDNVRLVRRLCELRGIEADFLWIERFEDFDRLATDYDCITAIGSLINAPLGVIAQEMKFLVRRLKPGGRFLHFAYPRARWEREGAPPLSEWGEMTDGPGTPWMEWHDAEKVRQLFHPQPIRILFSCEWHESDFNWFDIELA